MTTSNQRVSTVRSESDRMGRYLATLSAPSLSQPSACEGWRASDVVAHLILAVDMFGANIARGARGDSSQPSPSATTAASGA